MPRKPKKNESELALEAAREAGAKYAQDQLDGTYFHDWVWDQMIEGEEMRKRDPSSVIPLESKADYDRLARNMLQQLGWDIDRGLDPHEVIGDASREEQREFWDGLHDELKKKSVRGWLTDELIVPIHEEIKSEKEPEQSSLPGIRARESRGHGSATGSLTVVDPRTNERMEVRRIGTGTNRSLGGAPTETWVVHPSGDPGSAVLQVELYQPIGRHREWTAWTGNVTRASHRELAQRVATARNVADARGGHKADPRTWAEPRRRGTAPRRR